jgi:hypothetical protein
MGVDVLNQNRPASVNGDRATLRNRNGGLVDRCSWGHGDGVKTPLVGATGIEPVTACL